MGYTNYWYQTKSFTNEEWEKVLEEYDYIQDVLGVDELIIDDTKDYNVAIVFNGNPENDQDHETFLLYKDAKTKANAPAIGDITFNFCKTAEKPYDIAVWHLLSFAYHNTKAITKISRDR